MTIIDVYDIWQKLMSLCNVSQNGQIRPVTDFQGWYNSANSEMFHDKVAKFQLGQQVTDELSPFLTSAIVSVTMVTGRNYGVIAYPSNYENLADLRIMRQKDEAICGSIEKLPIIDTGGKTQRYTDPDYAELIQQYAGMGLVEETVNVVDTQNWGDCLKHQSKGPTYDNPKATQDASGIKIAPKGIQAVVLDYFHTPRKAIFAYTIANDIVIYNSGGSTQLEWTNIIENEFLFRLAMKYATAIGDSNLYQQFDNSLKQLG